MVENITFCHIAVFLETFSFNHYFILVGGTQRYVNSCTGKTGSHYSQCHKWVRTMRMSKQMRDGEKHTHTHMNNAYKQVTRTHRLKQ